MQFQEKLNAVCFLSEIFHGCEKQVYQYCILVTVLSFFTIEYQKYQDPEVAVNSNCSIPIHPKITSKASCNKKAEHYYPDCYERYDYAFSDCESDPDCVGVIKHMPEYGRPKYASGYTFRLYNHAPGGYYLCKNNFTINEIFVEPTNENDPDINEIFRPREVYKKKNGKGNLLKH